MIFTYVPRRERAARQHIFKYGLNIENSESDLAMHIVIAVCKHAMPCHAMLCRSGAVSDFLNAMRESKRFVEHMK